MSTRALRQHARRHSHPRTCAMCVASPVCLPMGNVDSVRVRPRTNPHAGKRARCRVALFLPSLAGGGAERVVLNLAAGLATRGFAVDLVLARAHGAYLPMVPANVRVVDLKVSRVLRALGPLAGYLRREKPAALLSALDEANVIAMTAARLPNSNTRTVITNHCTFPENPVGIRGRLVPWLLGRLHRWAAVIVAVSEGVADDVVRATGIPRQRLDVIYNPVITWRLRHAAAQPPSHPWLEAPTRPVVLGVGRLTPQKNFRLLIDAFAILRRSHDARLVILGEGPERAVLEARIREHRLDDTVALPGFLPNPYACMARAAVLVLSSDFEGLPTVLIESLALGTPVVATDCKSGPREILKNGALGELVPMGDASALAQAIARTLTNPPRAPAFDELNSFTLDTALDRFEAAFNFHA